jgi:hypothetical protein
MKLKVSLGLADMTTSEKIEAARQFVTSMTGNANFTTPFPSLTTVTNAANALEVAYNNAKVGGPEQTALMYDREEALDKELVQLGSYVEYIANGNEAIILSANMNVKKKGQGQPFVLKVTNGADTGEVIITCPSIPGAAYKWQIKQNPLNTTDDSGWNDLKTITIAKTTVSGLSPGAKYWFRVATIIKENAGDWSDPVSIIVQ